MGHQPEYRVPAHRPLHRHERKPAYTLCGLSPHVSTLADRTIVHPRQPLPRRTPDAIAQIAVLQASEVLDQSQQIRPSRRDGATQVVLTKIIRLASKLALPTFSFRCNSSLISTVMARL
jgi:hypothetical protein